ncbi:MAG: hypothetical protein N2489_00360 [Clostridia bacterium]|nr:hypothetical protein [Clostridia bacterium]
MTKIELLKKYHDMACHNLFCYSRNYAMTEPKDGYEAEWKQAGEEVELLEEIIEQQKKAASHEEAAKEKILKFKKSLSELKDSKTFDDIYPLLLKCFKQ